MKIVHVVYSLEMGGAEVMVAQLCRIQRAAGHQVSIFAYSNLGVVGEALCAEGFDIYVPGEAHPVRTMGRYLLRLLKLEPDVVHCHNEACTLQAALSARLAGVRRVVSTRHSLVAPPYNRNAEIKYGIMATFCDWVVGICDTTCANLRGAPLAHPGKIVRVYNGVPALLRQDSVAKVPGTFVVLFVGRLAEIKDLGTLLRAFALASRSSDSLECWVVGDGGVRGALEALVTELGVADRVRFFGQQVNTAGYFFAADLFAMSSLSEGLPMSLLQAMSIGLPAVTTDVGGMAEVLRLSGSGLLTPVGDAEAMADAILRIAGDSALRERFAHGAQATYAAEFTLEHMHEAYLALYDVRRPV